MATKVVVHKNRTNKVTVNLGRNVTGETFTSEVRASDDHTSTLIMTWTVVVVNVTEGILELTVDNSVTANITVESGFMDVKRMSAGEPLSVFDRPLEVNFRGTVTA